MQRRPGISPTNCSSPAAAYWLAPCDPVSSAVDNFDWAAHARINFIGLFDTVAAVIDPLKGDYDPANHLNPGINLYLPPGCARKVLQLTARDEALELRPQQGRPGSPEICLPGAHSDIGGGYRP